MSTSVSTVRDRWTKKIQSSQVLNQLILYADGKIDMTPARANACLRLVSKILPDLQSIQVDTNINYRDLNRLELEARMISLGYDPATVWKQLDNVIEHESVPVINQDNHDNDDINHNVIDDSD